jgi:hypothetical protein
VPNPKPRVPSSEFQDSAPSTRGSGFSVWHLALEFQVSGLGNSMIKLYKSQLPGFGFCDSAPGTQGSGFGMVKFHMDIIASFRHQLETGCST